MSKTKKKPADQRQLLLRLISEAYDLPNWNETNLKSSLVRVNSKMAVWLPRYAKHSIADIVVHCAYWKYALRRRLRGDRRGSFPIKGSNWFPTGKKLTPQQWRGYVELLSQQHDQMCDAIRRASQTLSDLRRDAPGDKLTWLQRLFGLAIHDAYHTGQINMIKAMYKRRMQDEGRRTKDEG